MRFNSVNDVDSHNKFRELQQGWSCIVWVFQSTDTGYLRSHWPSSLRRGSEATCLMRVRVRITPAAWLLVSCVFAACYLVEVCATSRGVVPAVVRRCVWSRNLVNEKAKGHVGSQHNWKEKKFWLISLQLVAINLSSMASICNGIF